MSRTFFSLRRRRGFSPRHPAPVTIEDAGLVSGPGVGFPLFHLSRFIFSSSDDADRFLKLASTRGCTVSTMVLSSTRGLVLFRVILEGIAKLYDGRKVQLAVKVLTEEKREGLPSILLEGDRTSLEWLADIILASAADKRDCGSFVAPDGPGNVYFHKSSEFGIYIHRLPCLERGT